MAAFRLFSKLNTFYGLTGQLLAGGELRFYDAGTTTPRDVYGDSDLAVNNGATVDLDSSGRPDVDVWGDGAYFVEAYDSLGVKQGEADDVSIPGAGGLTIPALETGKFLTNNGAVLLWSEIREVPDPTGQGGKVLGTDGEVLLWQNPPEVPDPPDPEVTIDGDNKTFTASASTLDDKFVIQVVTGSIAANNEKSMSGAVVFDTAFTALWAVHVQVRASIVSGGDTGRLPATGTTGWTPGSPATGANIHFELTEDDPSPANRFTSAVPYVVTAIGTVAKE